MIMKKVVSQLVPEEHYKADICLVWCFDDRFRKLREEFIRENGFKYVDFILIAGGAKDIASPDKDSNCEFILDQISKSIALHHTPLVAFMVHAGCGAYSASGVKFGNKDEEIEYLKKELEKAETALKEFLSRNNQGAEIKKYLADFDGLYEL